MLLRSLSNLIKPSNEQLRNKTNGQFTRLKIWLYQLLLRRLLKSYLHYAISDSIVINNGDIKIVHEFRDLGFESELIRNRIGFKSDMISHSLPIMIRKSKATRNFSFFNFKNLLSIYVDGKELFIKHDETFSIDGTVQGKIKCSTNDSCVSQSIIKILYQKNCLEPLNNIPDQRRKLTSDKKPTNQRQRKTTTSPNIFEREREISPITTPKVSTADKTEIINDIQPKAIEKKGFDIDTSF
jgi:hypothetical protein